MKKSLTILLAVVALSIVGAVDAKAGPRITVSFGSPGYYDYGYRSYGYAPTYYSPAPVYYRPAPVYYVPQRRVYYRSPVYCEPRRVYYGSRTYRYRR